VAAAGGAETEFATCQLAIYSPFTTSLKNPPETSEAFLDYKNKLSKLLACLVFDMTSA
jgi:hypothetical protein